MPSLSRSAISSGRREGRRQRPPKGVSAVVFDYFEKAWSLPPPGFRVRVFPAKLGHAKRRPDVILNSLRESQQIILARADPEEWLFARNRPCSRHVIILILGYYVKVKLYSPQEVPEIPSGFFGYVKGFSGPPRKRILPRCACQKHGRS